MRPNRHLLITGSVLIVLLSLLFLPWRTTIPMPAFLDAAAHVAVFPPQPARLEAIHVQRGQTVREGQPLFTLHADEIDFEIARIRQQIQLREKLVAREAAGGMERLKAPVLRRDLESDRARLQSQLEKRNRLTIRAAAAGQVVATDDQLQAGDWIDEQTSLAIVADLKTSQVIAYISEGKRDDLVIGAKAVFYPEALQYSPIEARVTEVAPVNTAYLQEPYLASIFDGPIAVEADDRQRLVPVEGIFRVVLSPTQQTTQPPSVLRGTVLVEGPGRSIAWALFRNAYMVLLRESGF